MGSNGTPDERLAEAEAARAVLGAAWRENLRLARPPHRQGSRRISSRRSRSSGVIGRGRLRCRTGPIAIPTTRAASEVLTEAVFNAGLRRYQARGEAWKAEWICYYFINDCDDAVVRHRRVGCTTSRSARRSTATRASSSGSAPGAVATRLNTPLFRQLIESRDAQFGALAGVRWAEGFVVREPILRADA